MKTRITSIIWAAVAACGCLDLQLLDDMDPMDAGDTAGADSDSDADADGDSDSDTDADGPPETDPDDQQPPELAGLSCGGGEVAQDELCVAVGPGSASIRLATDEPAVVAVEVAVGAWGVLSDDWSTEHHLGLAGLAAGAPVDVTIAFTDVNENVGSTATQVTAADGPPVAVTEVLADPLGAEPDQEFVEVANFGPEPVDLSGWMIDDNGDYNGDQIPEGTVLAAGQIGLLVSPDYDPGSAEDPAPDPAAVLIQLGSSIASSGLKNSEAESIELYDGLGGLVSCYQGQAGDPKEGRSAVRRAAELPDGDALGWELEPGGGSTPGTAPSLD